MNKIYKTDVSNMNWRLNNDYTIDKKAAVDGEYEYIVQFSATQDIDKTDNSRQKSLYRIEAGIDTEGKIASLSMSKIVQ